jgi:D-sedoheptulose 7-phosphate isomerase
MTGEPTSFLYPFIDAEERDAGPLLADLAASAREKIHTSRQLRAATVERCRAEIRAAADDMADRFARGGRLYVFGNGGSATDSEGTAAAFRRPLSGVPLPATSLVDDRALVTALGNDIGFDVVFARQLVAHARPDDIALGLSTSGGSANVLAAFSEARRRGLLTVGVCGYGGGSMAASGDVAHCIVVRSDSVHRIQEAQDAVLRTLWSDVQTGLPGVRS